MQNPSSYRIIQLCIQPIAYALIPPTLSLSLFITLIPTLQSSKLYSQLPAQHQLAQMLIIMPLTSLVEIYTHVVVNIPSRPITRTRALLFTHFISSPINM
ncbi:unnamed protein product [Periconia digitata]|uniref:Uncharacterized protein n=1 Tax=Periconia digitata TaxID=1303443 RepID=A0A9W4USF8_9PLEO|nr:unnamed protein product [Periconia digitata]